MADHIHGGTVRFTDNRTVAQQQKAIQRAATIGNQGGASPVHNYRWLSIRNGPITYPLQHDDTQLLETIEVQGNPGFGVNVGNINGNGYNGSMNSANGIHTEPLLIGRAYSGQIGTNWIAANAAINQANNNAGGAANRAHFALFTERHPCNLVGHQCNNNLLNARYHTNDTVDWRFANTQAITASYIGMANNTYPNYVFHVHPQNNWLLEGGRVIDNPKNKPKKKTDNNKKHEDDTRESDNSKFTGMSNPSNDPLGSSWNNPILV